MISVFPELKFSPLDPELTSAVSSAAQTSTVGTVLIFAIAFLLLLVGETY